MSQNERAAKPRLLKTILFTILVVAIISLLAYLSMHPEPRPALPDDADHRGITDWNDCLTCHGDGGPSPLMPSHPINKEQCFRCHQLDVPGRESP